MRLRIALGGVGFVLAMSACTDQPAQQALPSLERSGAAAFVCLGPNGAGRNVDTCPDVDANDGEDRYFYALVTQTQRGEVAVVNTTTGAIIDYDPNAPGYEFLPVGTNPVDIVATPGGVASFVGVAEAPDRHGIFALPSSCLVVPTRADLPRDLTTWPACALPSAPGNMMLLIDPPDASGRLRPSCDAAYDDVTGTDADPMAQIATLCPAANLGSEQAQRGRRKLLVALPDLGMMGLIDAQWILDQAPGSFGPCQVERWTKLQVDLPKDGPKQQVPADLQAPGCERSVLSYGPVPTAFQPRPAQFALADNELYVTDLGAPVIHRLDVTDPCSMSEHQPLLPASFDQPSRTALIRTDAIAVTPSTTRGKRYAFAADRDDGSVMIFDVSPTSDVVTPLVRSGTPRIPFAPADRIWYGSPPKALAGVLVDAPAKDPITGVAPVGQLCDPDPALSTDAPGASYRPESGDPNAAGPARLRGVFGMLALANGQIGVIDVEDFDAPCRRPAAVNPSPVPNFQGCAGDPALPDGFKAGSTLTVSDEISCNVVEPLRERSAYTMTSNTQSGVHAPSLKAFPRLRSPTGSYMPTGQSIEGRSHPKMLAVDFVDPPSRAVVYVGSQIYQSGSKSADSNASESTVLDLPVDPSVATFNSLAFDYREPRAFANSEDVVLTYEGAITGERSSGYFQLSGSSASNLLTDGGAGFCDRGVEDLDLARQRGRELGVPDPDLEAFARRHADYVQITADFPAETDTYWSTPGTVGHSCGTDRPGNQEGNGHAFCEKEFGLPTAVPANEKRDFVVFEAYQDHLVIQPRNADFSVFDHVYCCFGAQAAAKYRVRAGDAWVLSSSVTGMLGNLTTGAGDRCVRDCNARRALYHSRTLEVVDTVVDPPGPALCPSDATDTTCCLPGQCLVCQYPGPVPGSSPCVFQNPTTRFAIYRGTERSVRDMSFVWQYSGGFTPLYASLLGTTSSVLPLWMRYVPQLAQLVVADGSAEGLALVSLQTLRVSRLFR